MDIERVLVNQDYISKLMPRVDVRKGYHNIISSETLFINSIAIIKVILRTSNAQYKQTQMDQIINHLLQVYNVKTIRKGALLIKAQKQENLFKYSVQVAVIDTRNTSIYNSDDDHQLVLVASHPWYFIHQIIVFEYSDKYRKILPRHYEDKNKRMMMEINLSDDHVSNSSAQPITLQLKRVKKTKLAMLSQRFDLSCLVKDVMTIGAYEIVSSDIQTEGFSKWIKFGQEIELKINMQWSIRIHSLIDNYKYLRLSWMMHHQFLYYYLKFRSNQLNVEIRQCKKHDSIKISNAKGTTHTILFQLFPFVFAPFSNNATSDPHQRLNDLQYRNCIFRKDPTLENKYCIASEWCSIDSFYYHNPLICYLLVQHHIMFRIPDELILPQNLREVCKLLAKDKVPCFGLLSSLINYLKKYLRIDAGYISDSTREGRIFLESYLWLRSASDGKMFLEDGNIMLNAWTDFIEIIHWLKYLLKIEDSFCQMHCTILFYKILREWIIQQSNAIKRSCEDRKNSLPNEGNQRMNSIDDEEEDDRNYDFEVEAHESAKKKLNEIKHEPNNKYHSFSNIDGSICLFDYGQHNSANKTCIVIKISPLIEIIFKLHFYLLDMEPKLPFTNSSKIIIDLNNICVKFLIGLNKTLLSLIHKSHFTIQLDNKDDIVIKSFTLKLYSVAFDLQQFKLDLSNQYLNEESDFVILLYKMANFFSANSWIESAGKGYLQVNVFASINDMKELICQANSQFFRSYCCIQKNRPYLELLINDETPSKLWAEYSALKNWHELNRSKEKVFTDIFDAVRKCLSDLEKDLSRLIRNYEEKNCDVKLINDEVMEWLAKAVCYNSICIAICFTKNLHNICKRKKEEYRFATTIPGWFRLLKWYDIFNSKLDQIRNKNFGDKDPRVNQIFENTKRMTTLLFRNIYIKLTCDWLMELEFFAEWEMKTKGEIETSIYQLSLVHLVCGLSIAHHFSKIREFNEHYILVRKKLDVIIEKRKQEEKKKYIWELLEIWSSDYQASMSENPFSSRIWSIEDEKDPLSQINRLMDTNWNKIKNKRFVKNC